MNHRQDGRDPHLELDELVPPKGWGIRRHSEQRWWVWRDDQVVAELGVLYSGEWWVCPDDEVLPWARTYGSAAGALAALVAWWQVTRPWG